MGIIGHNHIRRVDNFDGFEVLAHPLACREDRVFRRNEGTLSPVAVTCGSHDVMIARPTGIGRAGRLAILMHHGGGRHVLEFYESALPVASALLLLPEREQYALAYALFEQADECAAGARASVQQRWAAAYLDGRIRKRRRGSSRYVYVETPAERELRRS
jgi:hypothetical protein